MTVEKDTAFQGSIGQHLFVTLFHFRDAVFEVFDGFAESAADLGQFAGAENDRGDDQNNSGVGEFIPEPHL